MDKRNSKTSVHSQTTVQSSIIPKNTETRRRIDIRVVQNVLRYGWMKKLMNKMKIVTTPSPDYIKWSTTSKRIQMVIIVFNLSSLLLITRCASLFQVHLVNITYRNYTICHKWTPSLSLMVIKHITNHQPKNGPKLKGFLPTLNAFVKLWSKLHKIVSKMLRPLALWLKEKELGPSFMYTQIFKDILLTIEFEPRHIQDFIDYCWDVFADNSEELKNVNKLEQEYRKETPIWWYTYECFLYPMLNGALRLMDGDIMMKMGFFIVDLHRHIEQLPM